MRAVYGAFTVEGAGAMPWSADDERRLRGRTPHVMTNYGPFVLNRTPMPRPPSRASIERIIAIGLWALERGDLEAARFYAQRAADLSERVVG